MPYIIKNRTRLFGRTCKPICANLSPETKKEVSFGNEKVKEMNGRGL